MMWPPSLLAVETTHYSYDWSRLQSLTEWWQKPLLVVVCLLIAALVAYMYRRDSVELRPGVGIVLLLLRLAAFGGLLVMFLDLQKRSEQKEVHNSRVAVLIDTSLSMALVDPDPAGSAAASSRIDLVVNELSSGELLTKLRQTNDVVVYRFDQDRQRVVMLGKLPAEQRASEQADESIEAEPFIPGLPIWVTPPRLAAAIGALLGLGIFTLLASRLLGPQARLTVALCGLAGAGGLGFAGWELGQQWNSKTIVAQRAGPVTESAAEIAAARQKALDEQAKFDWKNALLPKGLETRIGQALSDVLKDDHGPTVAGLVVISDGGQNAGIDLHQAIDLANEAKIPLYAIGIGSQTRAKNVRVSDFVAPARAFPGDGFSVTGYLQSQGLDGQKVTVDLFSRRAGKATDKVADGGKPDATTEITLGKDGEVVPVKFDVEGIAEPGRHTLRLQVRPLKDETDVADNRQEADVEIVDRKTHVLLFAGGPTREYQFMRNQLRRDKEMVVDVLLQTAQEGISQDADKILEQFPSTAKDLAEYDCIVAFDPDWRELDPQQIELLDHWLGEESGGMIAIAGPVFTDAWTQDPKTAKIRAMYPVEFNRRLSERSDADFGSLKPWPIEFTREGLEAEFLWLGDSAADSQQAWGSFPGVFGFYQVRGVKPSATVYARYSDPDASIGLEKPVYIAGHFYGFGRVIYLGSGEMWRLRAIGDGYTEQLYTKLVRHVSQGRLLRGSRHGSLLVEQDRYLLGNTVPVRAQLTDAQHQPLALPSVTLQVLPPNGGVQTVIMQADPARKGMYFGQFTALEEGTYRLEMTAADSSDEVLTHRIQVKVPDLERENPQRRDDLLSDMAARTGGKYYVGLPAALGHERAPALVSELKDHAEITPRTGMRDRDWEQNWMQGLLIGICGFLCLEWLLRRLYRLA